MSVWAAQGGNNPLKYGFILDRVYQRGYLNFDNEEHCKSPRVPLYGGADTQHRSTQRELTGEITNNSRVQPPQQPAASPPGSRCSYNLFWDPKRSLLRGLAAQIGL